MRSRINGVLLDGISSKMTDLLWRGHPLVALRRFEGGLSVVCEDHGVVRGCRCGRVVERRMGGFNRMKLNAQQAQLLHT